MFANAIAFVFGVWLLQQQAALPSAPALGGLVAAALALVLWCGYARLAAVRRGIGLLSVAICVACGVLGFAWAGAMAQWRLADALAIEAEQQDIQVPASSLPCRRRSTADCVSISTSNRPQRHRRCRDTSRCRGTAATAPT